MLSLPDWPVPRATAPVRATCPVPGSKSLTNRYLVLAALAQNPSTIYAPLESRDTALMASALTRLGATLSPTQSNLHVTPIPLLTPGSTPSTPAHIDCGLAGTVMRFVPPVAVATGRLAAFDGDPHARTRPMAALLTALDHLGAGVKSAGGFLPFTVTPPESLSIAEVVVDASSSSQFVSGLLLSAARFPRGLTIRHVGSGLPSRPHIDMTIETLARYGVEVLTPSDTTWTVNHQPIVAPDITVEPDLSNAATFVAAAIITAGTVTIPHWPATSTQAGHQFTQLAEQFGATTSLTSDGLTVTGPARITPIDVDLHAVGELTPVVAAVAAHAHGTSRLTGIGHLRGHETDRVTALATELTKAGAHVDEGRDSLTITSPVTRGCTWDSYDDHRMVMAGALIGLTQPVTITNPGTVGKTLPQFMELFEGMVSA